MQEIIASFDRHWQDFISRLRGRMLRQQPAPSFSQLDLMLSSYRMEWASLDTGCGRWLAEIRKNQKPLADQIEKILTEDMHFSQPPAASPCSPLMQAALPAGAMGVGGGTAALCGASLWTSLGIGAGAGVLAAAGMMFFGKARQNAQRQALPGQCLAQLETYRAQIIALLKTD